MCACVRASMGDSLTHLSGNVIIADTSLVVSVRQLFFMLRFQLGAIVGGGQK